MTHDPREVHRMKRILEYAERTGNINKTCRYFGLARSTSYLWRDRTREFGEQGLRSRRCGPHNHPKFFEAEGRGERARLASCETSNPSRRAIQIHRSFNQLGGESIRAGV